MNGDYVQITVHRDALGDALLTLGQIIEDERRREKLGMDPLLSEHAIRALQDVLDPLPEPDVNGYTPNIRYNVIPADLDLLAVPGAIFDPADPGWR